ncbi:TIGR04076 family protein [Phytoactinopolyspora alkaliphila]|uniref:TIGR04076 family protein n=1 Tax=Phytoactinopolyspora alkaliphila TaxID=1783498 RepID=A0A6N9YQ04_9ACTN|nr:TIGR04076 family protein [Phytoactinopolyspora alkaliphila]NED97027.1 TIGR04076 family protein [Phytoactinopolyspora alkaliphila]
MNEDRKITELSDLRVVVDRIEGRSVCGMAVGDSCEITRSSQLRIPEGRHFCLYALAAALPLLPAMQRPMDDGDWLANEAEIACPDPEERLIMRVERTGLSRIPTEELT